MALKDLVASKASLKEADIEAIVADYVRYDEDEKEIAFTPNGTALPARKKVLVYLVALHGWPFISSGVPTDASPAQISDHLGMPGGTVRPMLIDLRDRNLIVVKGGRYSVRAASLHAVKTELDGEGVARAPRAKKRAAKTSGPEADGADQDRRRANGGTRANGKSGSQQARFDGWIEAGFFAEPRTLGDVQKKFRQAGVIIARTSIPQLLLKAVRNDRLTRSEAEVNGKSVWVYAQAE
ncbi:hypothetical protein IVB27_21955 [Bradyrhizobium sp. 197]|uniref:hypothetical protein n=1 Tax=Bradyrhizobium sp. 197 TaxID=2782663 RepID=UPI001FFBE65A|nr:hypothetical protein [Bradyrhizobium sp. 197]MCK1477396.1 hypothetical protein [Bradyrhizobium sp. 197]